MRLFCDREQRPLFNNFTQSSTSTVNIYSGRSDGREETRLRLLNSIIFSILSRSVCVETVASYQCRHTFSTPHTPLLQPITGSDVPFTGAFLTSWTYLQVGRQTTIYTHIYTSMVNSKLLLRNMFQYIFMIQFMKEKKLFLYISFIQF